MRLQRTRLVMELTVIMVTFLSLMSVAEASAHGHNKHQEPLKYGIFTEECFVKFTEKQDFSDVDCIKKSVSKLVGYAIITGAFMLKVPQIIKIVSAGSVEGIAVMSYYTEVFMYTNTASFSMHLGLSFSVFGENLVILVQNMIIILLIWNYNKTIGIAQKGAFVVLAGLYMTILFQDQLISEDAWKMIQSSSNVMILFARCPQIYANFSAKSTGQLAFLTFLLNAVGANVRLLTVLVESDNFLYNLQFIVGAVLNTILLLQFFLYWNAPAK
eukprot:CAMPEP_0176372076 /NCGR_PEP_ID=MMETSP0126-20121128/25143_1 /TAXON_ID=141414 ORGANISM="Strombidinopsis acuminatum, Strain SPMC142" /NCGR_SAMPLE_ID=MMETSP0126 /ASSEMBLY_ACC=CAM_ASM_000229 /LENGTH=270 /DNA_ID=CAMNT_0017731785 /DNA_START=23 /DNA_END=835 /DNA_ORIENTATION=+